MFRHWYLLVGVLLLVVPLLGFVMALMVIYPHAKVAAPWWLPVSAVGSLACWGAAAPWFFWVCPWLAANDPPATLKRPPKDHAKELETIVQVPVVICLVLAVVHACLNVFDPVTRGRLAWYANPLWISLALLVPLVPWTWWLSRRVRGRFFTTLARRGICWRCGYDLRGNPDATACPECGEVIKATS